MLGTRHQAAPLTSALLRHLHASSGTRGGRPSHAPSHGLIRRHKPWRRSLLQQLGKTGKQLLLQRQQLQLPPPSVLSRAGAGLQKAYAQAFVWLRADMSPAWIEAELSRAPCSTEPAQRAALTPQPTASSSQGVGPEGSSEAGTSGGPGAEQLSSSSSSSSNDSKAAGAGRSGFSRRKGPAQQVALSRAFLEEHKPWGMSPEEQERVEDKLAEVGGWVYKIEEAYGPIWVGGKCYREGWEMSSYCKRVFDAVWKGSFFADVLPLLPGVEGEHSDWLHWLPRDQDDYWCESQSYAMNLGSRHFIREVYKCHSGCSSAFVRPLDTVCFPDLLREEAIIFTPEGGW